jgi:hypothetical protein
LLLVLLILLAGLAIRIWYASEALRVNRFVDEKYSLLNIRAIVAEGTLEPASSYYPYPLFNVPPAVLVAASDALHRWTGNPVFEAVKEEGFGPATLLLTRLIQTLYGAVALLLTYLIGREIFSREVGLIGASALAFMPWHIHASGYFKPDAQLVAMVLLAFYWSIKAVESPSLKNHLLAGAGIALAMSTKMTGGVVAIPLVIGTLVSGWRDKRRLGLLAVAGLTSATVFVLLNPYWRSYLVWLGGLERDYAMRAARAGMTRWQIPGRVWEFITDPYTLGAGLGALGVTAFLALAVQSAVHKSQSPEKRAQRWMFLNFPVVYTAAYAWKTAYFKDNNFLPVIPFFCLSAGWALVAIWKYAEGFWPVLTKSWVRLVGVVSICLALMPQGLSYAYRTTTPTTRDRALAFLARGMRPSTGRLVLVERTPVGRPVWEGGRRFGRGRSRIETVEDWRTVSGQDLDTADGIIFRPSSLEPDSLDRRRRRDVRDFRAQWFRSRGPSLVAVIHDWERVAKAMALPIRECRPRQRCRTADLPPNRGGKEWITLVVTLGFGRGESVESVSSIRVGDDDVPLLLASRTERGAIFMTRKLMPSEGATAAVFVARKELLRRRHFGIDLHRWQRAVD